jgi:hypothetical protein
LKDEFKNGNGKEWEKTQKIKVKYYKKKERDKII